MRDDTSRRPDAGFVLVAVLAVVALLALMLGAASLASRGAGETGAVASLRLQEDALVLAGMELAGHQLFGLRASSRSMSGQEVRLDGGSVTIWVSAEAGRVDLNGADATLLAAAYRAAGLDAGQSAEAFADRILAWREQRASGSEGRRPLAFRNVGDLREIAGLDDAGIVALQPFVTVYNPAGRIDPVAAQPALLLALPSISPEDVDLVTALPAGGDRETLFVLRSVFRGLETHLLLGEESRAYSVRIEARARGGAAPRTVRTVLMAPVTSRHAYHVAEWREEDEGRDRGGRPAD